MNTSNATARRTWTWLLISVCAGVGNDGALAAAMQSRLTIDGQLQSIAIASASGQKRFGLSEAGRPVVIDEFALVAYSALGPKVAFATPAFSLQQGHLAPAAIQDRSEVEITGPSEQSSHALLIEHQSDHAPNHRFAPTPTVTFVDQFVPTEVVDHRGFAIVDIGESGSVARVNLLGASGPFRNRALQLAIAEGIRSDFVDERPHGHRAYIAYEVRGQTVMQVGEVLVTLPMCCPCNPQPGYACP